VLALVAVGFLLTVRATGPEDAQAREPDVIAEYGLPVASLSANPWQRGEIEFDAAEDSRNIQLHNMAVWDSPDGSPNVFVSFTPISAEHMTGAVPFRLEVVDGEEVEVADVAPDLDESEVRIEVDGKPIEISTMNWYFAGYGDLAGADTKYMPVCLVRVARPQLAVGEHVVRVMIYDAETGATGEKVATFECGVAEL
jgi:hypothetical protein